MSSLATQDLSTTPQTSAPEPAWSSPAWAPAQPAGTSNAGLSDGQRALDATAAADAGMGAMEVSTLATFGLHPFEMDVDAAHRMAVGLQRMEALLACNAGNDTACDLAGPGIGGHQTFNEVGGDHGDELVVEDTEFTLRISTRTNPNGETERILLYQDIDGTCLSGRSVEPIEIIPQDADQDEAQPEATPAPQTTEEGVGSFLEGALLGDFAGNDSWSAVAGQTLVGFIPVVGQIADARDTLAAVKNVAEGKDGAWLQLAAAGIGWLPGIGDALKGGARVEMRLGKEVLEEGAERLVKETAEQGEKQAVKEGEKQAAKEGAEEAEERLAREGEEAASEAGRTTPSRSADPNATPSGRRTKSPANSSADRVRSDLRENEAADTLARNGYAIEQNPTVPGEKRPDYRIEGEIFDNIAPKTDRVRNIWDRAKDKIDEGHTKRIVLNLDDSAVEIEALREQFASWPIQGLEEVLVVRGGQVLPLFP